MWKLKCERERQEQSVWKGMIEMIRLNFPRGGNSALITFGWSYHSCKPAFIVFFLNTSSPKTFLNIFLFNHFLPLFLFVIVLNNIFHRFTILWWIKGGHISYISVSQFKCTLFVCCTAAKQINNNTFNEKLQWDHESFLLPFLLLILMYWKREQKSSFLAWIGFQGFPSCY